MSSFCTVSGLVVDPQGHPYIDASLVVVYVPAPTATLVPTIGSARPFQTVFAEAQCDATGRFVRTGLANNTLVNDGHAPGQQTSQWCFRFYTGPGYVPLIGFSWCGVINGDMDITSQLASVAPPITPPCGGGGPPPPTAPVISGLSPNSGMVGTTVTISGSNFGSGGTVTFNGTPATVTSWSPTSIVVTVPAGATTGNVVVTVGGLASNGMPFTVTTTPPPVPAITTVSPSSGPVGTSVVITGTNFGVVQGSSTVTFNGIPATATSWNNTTIDATVPTGASTGNVVVTTAGGSSNGVTFTVTTPPPPAPVLTAINPTSGTVSTNVNITLTGTALTGTTAVNASGGVTVSNVAVVSDTSVTATLTLPSTATTANITVTTPSGTSNAVIFSVTSTVVGPPTGGTTFALVSITGGATIPGGTYNGQAGISLFCATAWSPSLTLAIGTSVYVTGTGSYDGYFTLAGTSPGPDNFGMTLVAGSNANTNIIIQQGSIILGGTPPAGPTLSSISPNSSAANTAAVMTLAGTGFTGATAVNYSGTGITRANLQISSDTSLSTTFGISASATSGTVTVTTPAGTTNSVNFSVTAAVPPAAPLINSVSPASANPSTTANITLSGSGFVGNPGVAPTTVGYDGTGVTISAVTVVNDTSITCTLTIAAGATSGHLTVTTPLGTSNGASFAITGAAAPTTPVGYPAFIFGGVTITATGYVGQRGIYASMQTPVPATATAGASVTIAGTGTYDGTFVVASASGTDLVLVAGTNSATTIISRQGLIHFP